MRHLKLLMGAIAFTGMLITGCMKDIKPDDRISTPQLQKENNASLNQVSLTTAEVNAKLEKLRASLPAGYEKRVEKFSKLLYTEHPEFIDKVLRALKVIEPTACDANTVLNQWYNKELSDWTYINYVFAYYDNLIYLPYWYTLYFENSSANQYFGVNGEYTQRINKTFKDLKRFWNIQSNDIVVVGLHGSMLRDKEKLIQIDRYFFPSETQADAELWANYIIAVVTLTPQFRNGDHPIFSYNAFASSKFALPPYGEVPDKIMMGDGILAGYAGIGYDDVAPQAILAHEFGHHIQYQLNISNSGGGPEATRRTELMADAYAAYYLSHARGAAMQWKRVKQFLQVFFNIGDCSFYSSGHHGTPTQRMAAAEWGYKVADNAQKQGHILTAQQFTALFDAQLPELVKN